MTNEERKALVERLRGMKSARYTHLLEATAQIVADGKRIAELEARLVHAEGDCDDDCIYCDEWRMSRKGGVSDLGIGIVSPTTKLEVTDNRAALQEQKK